MYRGGRERRGTLLIMTLLMAALVMAIAGGCGGTDSAAVASATTSVSSVSAGTSEPSGNSEGVQVAEKMLGTFDELVAKVVDLAKDKPAAAVLKPQLEELYGSYVTKMTELNAEYLALRDSHMSEFGECNIYLGNYRGKHVADKDNALAEAVSYYNFELGDQEIVSMLSEKPVELLEVAVKQ